MGRLDGKVAVITGAARGMGEAEARLFVAEGGRVVLADVLDTEGERVAAELGDAARYISADVRHEGDWERIVAAAEEMGSLTILVNNAAILLSRSIADTTLDEYQQVIAVNQLGTFLGMRAAIEPMRRAGGGSIINISSAAAIAPMPRQIAYAGSKGAVRAMTKVAALELGQYGIRVNSVHPGGIHTPMGGGVPRAVIDAVHANIPIPRGGEPIEVATLALYLASDESSYCTGGEYVVDGGWLAGTILPAMSGGTT
jgi:3alpha(or 20beta)-hydroxysteroid dehydrogenase